MTWPAGLSLGEYCALVFAGVLSFEDGLKVVKARGESMAAAATVGELITPVKLTACQGLLLFRSYCRLLACLLTHTVYKQIATRHSSALLCFHLG